MVFAKLSSARTMAGGRTRHFRAGAGACRVRISFGPWVASRHAASSAESPAPDGATAVVTGAGFTILPLQAVRTQRPPRR